MGGVLRAAAAALVLLAGSPAFAQSAADRETARALMDEGDRKRDAGDHAGALGSYEAADAIMKVPTTGIEVARMQIAVGKLIEAKETLTRVLRPPARREPAPFVAARRAAAPLLDDVTARIPALVVVVTNATEPASLTIDREAIPAAATNAPRKVDPGVHTVIARAGAASATQDVVVAERETKTVTLDLTPPPSPVPPLPEKPVRAERPASAAPKVLTIGGFAIAAVGVGVGAVTGVMSLKRTSDLKGVCPNDVCPAARQGDLDTAHRLGDVSTIAFVAGGVGLATGIVGALLWRGQKRERVTAQIGPAYVGVQTVF